MNDKQAGNYVGSIHESDYEYPYYQKIIGADSHICYGYKSPVSTGAASRTGESARYKKSLCGDWHFCVDQYDGCVRQRWFDEVYKDGDGRLIPIDFSFDQWDTIPVPSSWNLQRLGRLDKDLYFYEGSVVYTRTFEYRPLIEGERVFLRFGAAAATCKIFLNKQYLGMHIGGYTPFCAEVTDILRRVGSSEDGSVGGGGSEDGSVGGGGSSEDGSVGGGSGSGGSTANDAGLNRLIVSVNNTRRPDGVPTDNTDWFNYGGLYREVSLLHLPATFIRDFYITLVPDGTYSKIEVSVKTDGAESNGTAVFNIPELNLSHEIAVSEGTGKAIINMPQGLKLWNPDNPYLYDVTVSYGEDILAERVGFREIAVRDGGIYLNGKEIFLKGVCTHEESVLNGNAVTEAEIRENFALAKEMGCNFMRLAHYPHTEAAAYIADEAGMLLWEEIPVYWAIEFDNPGTYKNAENQLSELILRDRNRASVIIWSVGNENADTDSRLEFMSKLAMRARELDGSRLISAACLIDSRELKIRDRLEDYLDIIGINEYYGWYVPDFSQLPKIFDNSRPSKPVVITEFGADAKAGLAGKPGELYTEENQKAVYERQLEVLKDIPYVKGIAPWIFYDFRCPRRLHHMQNYYNIKGLLSADKKYKKPAFEVMQRFYNTL